MTDETESIRKEMLVEINAQPGSREYLEGKHGQVWTTSELSDDYEVLGFMAPVVVVRRKSDGQKGSLMFQLTFRTSPVDYLRITAARARGPRMSGAAMMPGVPREHDDQWVLLIIASRSFRT
jgi:hypothetical protein